ncbi:MAG: fluoride efflux transporter CrcB [Actinomycetota bacterium]|jgi:CrcB protein|nr:fluoride efflux transporter CrcB [Actinomycetota bacterium]
MNLLAVASGGAIGASLRYLLGQAIGTRTLGDFPWHTLAANVSGAFLLGLLMTAGGGRIALSHNWRMFLGVGLLGGYTTFSTFSFETIELLREGAMMHAAANAFGSLALGLVAAAAGIAVGRAL